jgi:flagellar motor switch protein FliM
MEPLKEVLKTDFQAKIIHVEAKDLASVELSCSEHSIMALIHVEPRGKKVLVIFDSLLAKILVHKILAGAEVETEHLLPLQMKPLTALEEAVVEYILVSAIEKISAQDFSLTFEDVIRDPQKLTGYFSHQENFAEVSLDLSIMNKDFFVKLVLPLSVADNLGLTIHDEYFQNQRLKQFEKFHVDFQLEMGKVTLTPSDLAALDNGDIVMLDEVSVDLSRELFHGRAHLKLCGELLNRGYEVDLVTKGDVIQAKVIDAI